VIRGQTLIENIVQAVARDLLVTQICEIEGSGGPRMVFSVHDEVVFRCSRCTCPRADEPVARGLDVEAQHEATCPWVAARRLVATGMSSVPAALPSLAGLPVACELSDAIRSRYGK
jgi:hypothetical protein